MMQESSHSQKNSELAVEILTELGIQSAQFLLEHKKQTSQFFLPDSVLEGITNNCYQMIERFRQFQTFKKEGIFVQELLLVLKTTQKALESDLDLIASGMQISNETDSREVIGGLRKLMKLLSSQDWLNTFGQSNFVGKIKHTLMQLTVSLYCKDRDDYPKEKTTKSSIDRIERVPARGSNSSRSFGRASVERILEHGDPFEFQNREFEPNSSSPLKLQYLNGEIYLGKRSPALAPEPNKVDEAKKVLVLAQSASSNNQSHKQPAPHEDGKLVMIHHAQNPIEKQVVSAKPQPTHNSRKHISSLEPPTKPVSKSKTTPKILPKVLPRTPKPTEQPKRQQTPSLPPPKPEIPSFSKRTTPKPPSKPPIPSPPPSNPTKPPSSKPAINLKPPIPKPPTKKGTRGLPKPATKSIEKSPVVISVPLISELPEHMSPHKQQQLDQLFIPPDDNLSILPQVDPDESLPNFVRSPLQISPMDSVGKELNPPETVDIEKHLSPVQPVVAYSQSQPLQESTVVNDEPQPLNSHLQAVTQEVDEDKPAILEDDVIVVNQTQGKDSFGSEQHKISPAPVQSKTRKTSLPIESTTGAVTRRRAKSKSSKQAPVKSGGTGQNPVAEKKVKDSELQDDQESVVHQDFLLSLALPSEEPSVEIITSLSSEANEPQPGLSQPKTSIGGFLDSESVKIIEELTVMVPDSEFTKKEALELPKLRKKVCRKIYQELVERIPSQKGKAKSIALSLEMALQRKAESLLSLKIKSKETVASDEADKIYLQNTKSLLTLIKKAKADALWVKIKTFLED